MDVSKFHLQFNACQRYDLGNGEFEGPIVNLAFLPTQFELCYKCLSEHVKQQKISAPSNLYCLLSIPFYFFCRPYSMLSHPHPSIWGGLQFHNVAVA